MVVIEKSKVIEIYRSLLNGTISYDFVNKWALEMMELEDNGKLSYEPHDEENTIWELITYLYGINMPSMLDHKKTGRSNDDIRAFLKEQNIDLMKQ